MTRVAGVDGTPKGWAVVIADGGKLAVHEVRTIKEILKLGPFDILVVDVPAGLLDAYVIGGRDCDRKARKVLGPRASSVFPAPVRAVLEANSWEEGCRISRDSSPCGKAITRQTFAIVPKIKEVDQLLQERPELRGVIREVHPEVSFCELVGRPMSYSKTKSAGREERLAALSRAFPGLATMLSDGKAMGLPIEDMLDATVVCWSARRLAARQGRSLRAEGQSDATGLSMAIWV